MAAVLLPLTLTAQESQPLDSIVALVEEDVILKSELDEAIDRIERQAAATGERMPPRRLVEGQILERLIMTRLEILRATDTGIRVSDADVDQALQEVAQQNNISLTQLRQRLELDGVDFTEFRRNVHDEILSSRLRQRVVGGMEEISDTEIEILLTSNRLGGAEYLLSHIVITVTDSASPDDVQAAEERARDIRQRLEGELDFATAALTFSQGPNALEGGDVGWRSINTLPPVFAEAIEKAGVGGITDVLRSSNGFVILQVRDRREQAEVMVREFRARHLMISPNELITPQRAEQRIRDLHQRLLDGESIAELAREHSMDESSSNIGGLLNWFPAGTYGAEFQQVLDQLDEGELSQPFQTPNGWHLLLLEGEREADRTVEAQRAEARDILFRQKAEEEVERFLRRLRDESFVEIRL